MKTARELAKGAIAALLDEDGLTKLLEEREREIGEAAAAITVRSVLESLENLRKTLAVNPKLRRTWKDAPAVRLAELIAHLARHYGQLVKP